MNRETFKICSRAYFPNCKFKILDGITFIMLVHPIFLPLFIILENGIPCTSSPDRPPVKLKGNQFLEALKSCKHFGWVAL